MCTFQSNLKRAKKRWIGKTYGDKPPRPFLQSKVAKHFSYHTCYLSKTEEQQSLNSSNCKFVSCDFQGPKILPRSSSALIFNGLLYRCGKSFVSDSSPKKSIQAKKRYLLPMILLSGGLLFLIHVKLDSALQPYLSKEYEPQANHSNHSKDTNNCLQNKSFLPSHGYSCLEFRHPFNVLLSRIGREAS